MCNLFLFPRSLFGTNTRVKFSQEGYDASNSISAKHTHVQIVFDVESSSLKSHEHSIIVKDLYRLINENERGYWTIALCCTKIS